ncbi:MAG: hypothetical protein CSB46_11340 [Micrococcales bacterium]|nr:MAG: hypothetical protein CSB46_11340 [Micrococcales bacterium]
MTGSDGAGYVRAGGDASWTRRGGILVSAPAVARVNGLTHQIGVNTFGALVHRTSHTGWRAFSPAGGRCDRPTAAVRRRTVVVSCIAPDGSARWFSFDGTTPHPAPSRLRSLGGRVSSLQVATSEESEVFVAVGGPYRLTNTETGQRIEANTYFRTAADLNWFKLGYRCDGHPASAMTEHTWFMACNSGDSILVVTGDAEQDAYTTYSVPGVAAGLTSVVATSPQDATLFVQGLDGYVRHRSISLAGPVATAWTQLSGRARYGVAAGPMSDMRAG